MTLIKENLKTKGQAYYPAKTVAANAMRVQCDFTQNPDGTIHNIENGAVYLGSTYIGNFYGTREMTPDNNSGELKVNFTNLSAENIVAAGTMVHTLLTEIINAE